MRISSLVLAVALGGAVAASPLPEGVAYDESIPHPAEFLGEAGERHVMHAPLSRYMERVAASSDRVRLELQGRTHEGRAQQLLIVSAPENLAQLEAIRQRHAALSDPARPPAADEELAGHPAVVWLGYSVHGNEASGSNAAPWVAYHLAAATGAEIDEWLRRTIVLIDPSFNPDGLDRFAVWANMHRGRVPVADPEHREHREGWPSARTNHYWFDLNRDWLLLQHPESRNRVRTFHAWRPNLLGDYHEMGVNATYFFQPGVPDRNNPLIPREQRALTRAVAAHHARAFDDAGELYYSEESFDDFYPGKGSTYPDLNGGVGVLFEQASARGHVHETDRGRRRFADAVANQFRGSLSMISAAVEQRPALLRYQQDFHREALRLASRDPVAAYVFAFPQDPVREARMLEILLAHGIEVYRLGRDVQAEGESFAAGRALVVPTAQAQYRLLTSLFERRTTFESTTFYDVSAWTLPLAFDARWAAVPRRGAGERLLGERIEAAPTPLGGFEEGQEPPYAWAFAWDGFLAPRAAYRLLAAGLPLHVATRPFDDWDYGTIVIPAGSGDVAATAAPLLREAARSDGVDVRRLDSGWTAEGIDLGSPAMRPLALPSVLLAAGRGLSSYEVGEAWHLLDHRMEMPVSLVEVDRLGRIDLDRYTHVVLVDGDFGNVDANALDRLRAWLRAGGVVVASKRAAVWSAVLADVPGQATSEAPAAADAAQASGEERASAPSETESAAAAPSPQDVPYADYERARAREFISGTIFATRVDTTHPLAFGLDDDRLPVFRNGRSLLDPPANPWESVARYTADPLLAGFASPTNVDKIAGSAALTATRVGRGTLIRFADNPNFRGVWYGTNKLFLNAIFFGPVVKRTQNPEKWRAGD